MFGKCMATKLSKHRLENFGFERLFSDRARKTVLLFFDLARQLYMTSSFK